MNAQIQYGSAERLTSRLTQFVRRRQRLSEPGRFDASARTSRSLLVLIGGSLLLIGGLAAVPREMPSLAIATVVGGAWLALVLAMTLPPAAERAGQELARRLGQFRHALNSVGDEPSRAQLQALLTLAHQLQLRDEEIPDELTRIHASLSAIELRDRMSRGEMPIVTCGDGLAHGERCHFQAPVRLGRRRLDQVGHLHLTNERVVFHGPRDLQTRWSDVADVQRADRDLIVSTDDGQRTLRFCCQTVDEAVRGGVLAQHLMTAARHAVNGDGASHQPAGV